MADTIAVAVPRKGRPLEAVLERIANRVGATEMADDIISILRYEKAITKGKKADARDVYERLAEYSDLSDHRQPEFTLLRDDREGMPRRVVFDSVTVEVDGYDVQLVGREEPFRALRTHSFALGFDSADLVLEEVVGLRPEPLGSLEDINARIDPHDTDVRVVTGLGDTVYHTLMATPDVLDAYGGGDATREFIRQYEGQLCISPRYERLVEAVLGTEAIEDVEFCYPAEGREEEAAIADVGAGVYLTMTGSTARDHGLELGTRLFPSETVLMENEAEATPESEAVKALFDGADLETALAVN
ncbi:hypothetical protein [Haloarchaeobius amylolyticus]|uniref:hypothetical protein n=1 Tax=Haloarchaeobius amylolyticus TaxID=1198296 RepID=UPI00226E6ACA|nr:hypothetical protein [Haloarchaeobius amylolyticus]